MITRSVRPLRLALLVLMLSTAFAGVILAGEPPLPPELSGKACAPAMSLAAPQPDLTPVGLTTPAPKPAACHWAIYDEFWKNGEVCRYGDTCSRQYFGTCPNGWDQHTTEIFPCCS